MHTCRPQSWLCLCWISLSPPSTFRIKFNLSSTHDKCCWSDGRLSCQFHLLSLSSFPHIKAHVLNQFTLNILFQAITLLRGLCINSSHFLASLSSSFQPGNLHILPKSPKLSFSFGRLFPPSLTPLDEVILYHPLHSSIKPCATVLK